MVDAVDSKSTDREIVPVRFRPPVPVIKQEVSQHWPPPFFMEKSAIVPETVPVNCQGNLPDFAQPLQVSMAHEFAGGFQS